MDGFGHILLYALLPFAGHLIGSIVAETIRTPKWVVGVSLHAAAGIAIAVVAMDLMPRILPKIPVELIVTMFLVGAIISVALAILVGTMHTSNSRPHQGKAWLVYSAVAADLVSDGTMTGAGTAIGGSLGLLLAASQTVANIPGGFAATANLRSRAVPRMRRLVMSGMMVVPVVLSAAVGFWLLGNVGPSVQYATLALIAGLLLLATVEDIIPEADAPGPPRWISSIAFASGFAGLALLSSGLE